MQKPYLWLIALAAVLAILAFGASLLTPPSEDEETPSVTESSISSPNRCATNADCPSGKECKDCLQVSGEVAKICIAVGAEC